MRRALITGSAGFVGRHMEAALRSAGWSTRGVDLRNRRPVDCRDAFRRPHRYQQQLDLVVHCAAMVDGRETIEGSAGLLGAYNLQLDGALFEWALRTRPKRIVYFSSSAAYPTFLQHCHRVPLSETDILDRTVQSPDATYGLVKLVGERLAQELRKSDIAVTVVRPFSGYGEDQDDRYPFPAMIARARRRENPFVVWGDGTQVRDFVHVDDVVGAVLALIDAEEDGPVNIGTGVPTSMDDLARLAMRTAGYEAPIRHLADKPRGVEYRVADTSKLRRFYTPKVTLEEGVARALGV